MLRLIVSFSMSLILLRTRTGFCTSEVAQDCTVFGEMLDDGDKDYNDHTFIQLETVNQVGYLQEIEMNKHGKYGLKVGLFSESGGTYRAKHLTDWLYQKQGKILLPFDQILLTDPQDHIGWVMEQQARLIYAETAAQTGVMQEVTFTEGDEHALDSTTREYAITVKVCADINQCASNPCINWGTCLYQPGGYICQCTEQFEGTNCEIGAYLKDISCAGNDTLAVPLISGTQYYVDHPRMTASSQCDEYVPPFNARIDRLHDPELDPYWAAQDPADNLDQVPEWIQVDLFAEFRIRKVATQGSTESNGHVTSYRLQFSKDGEAWFGSDADYAGNTDDATIVENPVHEEEVARYVKLLPQTFSESIAMRWEIYGCWEEMVDVVFISGETMPEVYVNEVQMTSAGSDPPLYNLTTRAMGDLEVLAVKLDVNVNLQNGLFLYTSGLYSLSGDRGWKCMALDGDVPAQDSLQWYSKNFDDSSWPDPVLGLAASTTLPNYVAEIESIEWIWVDDDNANLYCRGLVDACYRRPCLNNASCVDLEEGFNCTCPAGYEGRLCGTETDECLSYPCVNGICRDLVDGFECSCVSGYGGELCTDEIDECLSTPCVNGACEDLSDSFECSCDAGFQGELCSDEINGCASDPCEEGECVVLLDGYECIVDAGSDGDLSSNQTDYCLSAPCNNGTCIVVANGFVCQCQEGIQDSLCVSDRNEDECDSCTNTACVKNGTDSECTSWIEYDSQSSEESSQCLSSPCQNGTCHAVSDGYECICVPGFEGVHCGDETDECLSSPCVNGECVDFVDQFECKCSFGYFGTVCQSENTTDERSKEFNSDLTSKILSFTKRTTVEEVTTTISSTPIVVPTNLQGSTRIETSDGSSSTFLEDLSLPMNTEPSTTAIQEESETSETFIVKPTMQDELFNLAGKLFTEISNASTDTSDLAEFEIVCVTNNCGQKLKTNTEKIVYQLECTSYCNQTIKKSIEWIVLDYKNTHVKNALGKQLNIEVGAITEPGEYTIRVSVDYPGGDWTDEVLIEIAAQDRIGRCTISPEKGIELETEFTVSCFGWSSATGSLKFIFYQRLDINQRVKLSSMNNGHSAELKTTLLPGGKDNGFKTSIEIVIKDSNGQEKLNIQTALVEPTQKKEVVLTYLEDMLRRDSQLTPVEMARSANVLAKHKNIVINETLKKTVDQTFASLKTYEKVDVSDVGSVSYTITVALNVVGPRISFDQTETVKGTVETLMTTFRDDIKNMNSNAVKEIGTCLLRVMTTVSATMKSTDTPDSVLATSDAVAANLEMVQQMKALFTVMQDNLILGRDPIELESVGLVAKIGKVPSKNLERTNLTTAYGEVILPADVFKNETILDECVSFHLAFFAQEQNPYWSDISNRSVEFGVGQFNLSNCDSDGLDRKRKRSILSQFVTAAVRKYAVKLTKPDYKDKMKNVNETLSRPDELVYHSSKVDGTENLHINVQPKSNTTLFIFVGFDFAPTRQNYSLMYVSPNTTVAEDVKHSYFVDKEIIANRSVETIYVGVGQACNTSKRVSPDFSKNISYSYALGTFQCMHWDEEWERWEILKECEAYQETKDHMAVKPKKYGAVASLFVMRMNTLNLKMIFTDFDEKMKSNYSVWVTLLISTVIFIVGIICLRRLDNKDHDKWTVISLLDNDTSHEFSYEIHFHTGDMKDGGLKGNIFIDVEGEDSNLGKRMLEDWQHESTEFITGNVKGFFITCEKHLGTAKSVSLFIPKTLTELNWYLDFVVVIDLQTLQWWPFFHCNYIRHSDEAPSPSQQDFDEQEHTFLKLKDKEKHVTVPSMFRHNFYIALRESHTWFSGFLKKVRSTFTRVQRWCCCILAMTGCMLFNALWFDTSLGEHEDQGPVFWGIPTKEIVKSVYITIFVSAGTTLVAYVYSKTNISPKEASLHYMSFAPISQMRTGACLPHFTIYISHAVVILFILSTWVVCVLFSIQWGPHVADAWIISFVLGMLFNIIIWEPAVLLFGITFGTCCKHNDLDLGMYHVIFDQNKSEVTQT